MVNPRGGDAPPRAGVVRARLAAEDGSGLLSTAFGLLTFLVLLLVAVHAFAHLYASSVVDAVVYDIAVEVSGAAAGEPCGASFQAARDHAAQALGAFGDDLMITCARDSDAVVVTARGPSLGLAPAAAGAFLGEVERRARAQVEPGGGE